MHNMVLPYYENLEKEIAMKQHEKDVEKKLKRYLNKIGKKLRWKKRKQKTFFAFLTAKSTDLQLKKYMKSCHHLILYIGFKKIKKHVHVY